MWYICDAKDNILHAALWKFSPKAVWTDKKILCAANGQLYFDGDPDPSIPSTPGSTPTDTVQTAEYTDPNYYICASKYSDGWLSAYGQLENAGVAGGLTIMLPGGFTFRDSNYGVTGCSTDAEEGGAGDFFKILSRSPDRFVVMTSHLEDELMLEMTDETYSFMIEGRWK